MKNSEFRTQKYDLGDDVVVSIRFHKDRRPKMQQFDRTVIVGEEVPQSISRPAARLVAVPDEPQTNGPTADTPELIAMKASLQQRHPKPFTSADAFAELTGEGITPQELEMGLMAAVSGGAPVV
jgi:hypothetical protein